MKSITELSVLIQKGIETFCDDGKDDSIMLPVNYLLSLGGKRIRPLITLVSAQTFTSEIEAAIHPALAIEVFHNFTLMHDDIMDKAPLRRGMPTVHEKWNNDAAILSGDAMLIRSYELLCKTNNDQLPALLHVFNRVALDVCRGQQLDMDFQNLEMIRLKTSVLLGAAAEIGAICGGANEGERKMIYEFAIALGMSFQLQDDFLDTYGKPEVTGKQVGGDILANKKTLLSIHALSRCNTQEREILLGNIKFSPTEKIQRVLKIYEANGSSEYVRSKSDGYFQNAMLSIEALKEMGYTTEPLMEIAMALQVRKN
jgi:geranylgeranyl diphosphate synthase type II